MTRRALAFLVLVTLSVAAPDRQASATSAGSLAARTATPVRPVPAVSAGTATAVQPVGPVAPRESGQRQLWRWPLSPPPRVQRFFVIGPFPWSPGHRGVDLLTRPGQPVLAPAAGSVHFTGVVAGRPVLSIDHGDGVISSFESVTSTLTRGAVLAAGQSVGTVAGLHGHCPPATCLHWGVRVHGRYVDPLLTLGLRPGPAVLLPLTPDTGQNMPSARAGPLSSPR